MRMPACDVYALVHRFGLALGIGLMIGIEREREKTGGFAGIRTFPLIAMGGAMTAMLNDLTGWSFVAGLLVVGGFVMRTYRPADQSAPGMTTEVAAMLAYLLGGFCWWDAAEAAGAIAAAVVLLLAAKQPLENLVRRLGHEEIMAAAQLSVISLIVLPLIPDRSFGPLDVLNPHKIWIMVILISAVNLACHLLRLMIGAGRGIELAGVAGGLGSSTAVTLSFARQSRDAPHLAATYASGILLASAVMFMRVAVIVAAIQPLLLRPLSVPLAILVALSVGAARVLRTRFSRDVSREPSPDGTPHLQRNPLELWSAVQFGLLFAIVMFVARAAHVYLGATGIYASSAAAGLADVDAITVSLSDMASAMLPMPVAARGIVIALCANTLVKMAMAVSLGHAEMRRIAVPALLAVASAGLAWVAVSALI